MKKYLIILLVLIVLSFLAWAQHMFMSGVNPFVSNLFVIPLAIIFLVGLVYLLKEVGLKTSNKVATLFGISFVLFLILGALQGILLGNSAIDIQLHDTYYVIAYSHTLFLFSLIFGFYAIAYYGIPKLINRKLNIVLGQLHFWLTSIGVYIFFFQTYNLSTAGVPRRYYSVDNPDTYRYLENANNVFVIVAIVVLLAQLLFVANLVYTLVTRPKMQEV